MIRVVLDTNVLVSGIFWSGAPSHILEAWHDCKIKLVTSPDILQEYSRVTQAISRKYKNIDISRIIELVTILSDVYQPVKLDSAISRDPDDDKFIACALSAGCHIIVSGDKDLLDVGSYGEVKILSPSDFLKAYNLV